MLARFVLPMIVAVSLAATACAAESSSPTEIAEPELTRAAPTFASLDLQVQEGVTRMLGNLFHRGPNMPVTVKVLADRELTVLTNADGSHQRLEMVANLEVLPVDDDSGLPDGPAVEKRDCRVGVTLKRLPATPSGVSYYDPSFAEVRCSP